MAMQNRDVELSRAVRRPLAVWSVIGYPLGAIALTNAATVGVPKVAAASFAVASIVAALVAMALVWRFRGQLAQQSDDALDERQLATRDRAYLESYRVLSGVLIFGLLVVGIASDVLDRPITLTFATTNWFMMGAILISVILPSAIVAWQEPDLPSDD